MERAAHDRLVRAMAEELGYARSDAPMKGGLPFLRGDFVRWMSGRTCMAGRTLEAADIERLADTVEDLLRGVADEDGLNAARRVFRGWAEHGMHLTSRAGRPDRTVAILDFATPGANRWSVVSERTLFGPGRVAVRPDVLSFANGLPLCLVELKAPDVDLEEAKRQIGRYRADAPALFTCVTVSVACNESQGTECGGAFSPPHAYARWLAPADGTDLRPSWLREALAILSPRRLLALTRDGVVPTPRGEVLLRRHQFEAFASCRAAALAGRGGFVSHTMSAGKTFLMAALGRSLAQAGRRVVLVCDRLVLERQTLRAMQGSGLPFEQAESTSDLVRLLGGDAPLVLAMIHKFNPDRLGLLGGLPDGDDGALAEALESLKGGGHAFPGTFVVLVDEAQRSQAGRLHAALRALLPGAAIIGFTGTPVGEGRGHTGNIFGDCLHAYAREQALRDGVVVPVDYEDRTHIFRVEDPDGLDAMAERVMDRHRLGAEDRRRVVRNAASRAAFANSPAWIRAVSEDVAKTMREEPALALWWDSDGRPSVPGTAMLSTESIAQAYRFHARLAEAVGDDSVRIVTSFVPTREELRRNPGNVAQWTAARHLLGYAPGDNPTDGEVVRRAEDYVRETERLAAEDPLRARLIITVNMLTVGFNAPPLTFLFIARFCRDHGLLQLIGRIERPHEPGKRGVIVDYVGITQEIENAYMAQRLALLEAGAGIDWISPEQAVPGDAEPLPDGSLIPYLGGREAGRVAEMRRAADTLRRCLETLRLTGDPSRDIDEALRPHLFPDGEDVRRPPWSDLRQRFYAACRAFRLALVGFEAVMLPQRHGAAEGELAEWKALRDWERRMRPCVELGSGDRRDLLPVFSALREGMAPFIDCDPPHVLHPRDADGLLDAICGVGRRRAEDVFAEGEDGDGEAGMLALKTGLHRVASSSEGKTKALSSLLLSMLREAKKRRVKALDRFLEIQSKAQQALGTASQGDNATGGTSGGWEEDREFRSSPASQALFEAVGNDPGLFRAVRVAAGDFQHGWRSNPLKERLCERAVMEVLGAADRGQDTEGMCRLVMAALRAHPDEG